jgi:hypothetical protein
VNQSEKSRNQNSFNNPLHPRHSGTLLAGTHWYQTILDARHRNARARHDNPVSIHLLKCRRCFVSSNWKLHGHRENGSGSRSASSILQGRPVQSRRRKKQGRLRGPSILSAAKMMQHFVARSVHIHSENRPLMVRSAQESHPAEPGPRNNQRTVFMRKTVPPLGLALPPSEVVPTSVVPEMMSEP